MGNSEAKPVEEDHTDLIDERLDPIKAIEEKLRRGRVKYGPEWIGRRPILEAHDEALDLGAYLLTEFNDKDSTIDTRLIEELMRTTINIVHGVRIAIRLSNEE